MLNLKHLWEIIRSKEGEIVKKTLKKILICILIILIINNFLIYDCSFAATAQTQADSAIGKFLGDLLESVIGLLTYPYRIIALTVGYAVDSLTAGIAYSQGTADAKGTIKPKLSQNQITPFDILFNHVALVDVNFFNITNQDTVIMNIRKSVAQWFYVMRTIAFNTIMYSYICWNKNGYINCS